jgi:hypothetical protein
VNAETPRSFPDAAGAAEYLRCRTYLLENPRGSAGGSGSAHSVLRGRMASCEPIT